MEAFLIVLGAIVVIAIACAIASQFKKIAEMKGHNGSPYFWWSLLLGPIGMLMVVALPDRANPRTETQSESNSTAANAPINQSDELPDL